MAINTSILEAALRIATGGLTGVIFDTTAEIIRKGSKDTLDEPIAKLREDTERQKLAMEMAQAQARVAQELAIARRIEGAKEVQIEEYYEYAGNGAVGLKADDKGLTVGVSGSGQRVSKRIYKFTGGETIDADVQVISDEASAPPITKKAPVRRKKEPDDN